MRGGRGTVAGSPTVAVIGAEWTAPGQRSCCARSPARVRIRSPACSPSSRPAGGRRRAPRQSRGALRRWERVLRVVPAPWPVVSRRREDPGTGRAGWSCPRSPRHPDAIERQARARPRRCSLRSRSRYAAAQRRRGADAASDRAAGSGLATSSRSSPSRACASSTSPTPGSRRCWTVRGGPRRSRTSTRTTTRSSWSPWWRGSPPSAAHVAGRLPPQRPARAGPAGGAGSLPHALARRTLDWMPFKDTPSSRVFVHADDAPAQRS